MRTLALAWLAILPGISALVQEADAMLLADNGAAKCVIVTASNPPEYEKTAARELADHLKEVTGAEFAIKAESEVPADAPQILVGKCQRALRLVPAVCRENLGHDGIVIKTCGNALVLLGSPPRGTLYAVYTFLEDYVGCRWWTSSESTIPRRPKLSINTLDKIYSPPLRYREAFYRDVIENPLFAAKLKLNGHFPQIPASHGGHYSIIGFVHTFYRWLPPEKYFKDHPEWYSEINGKRTTNYGQLCLTNEECRKEMTRVVLEQLRADPAAGMISVSQNDWGGKCECANCKALEEREGSPSGPIIHFVNAVAEEVEKEFPDALVETLAYSYSRKPPLHVKPRRNVIVRLCTIECSFSNPLDSDVNKAFRDDIRGWSAISPHLFIWDYVTDFASYIQPHPNLRVLAPNLRFFVANNTSGVFEQGDAYCSIGDFVRLRAWVLGHLEWNPSLDAETLIDEFLAGYYGKAAPHLRKYIDLVHDACKARGTYLGCYNKDLTFLTLDVMNEAERLWKQAETAVRDNPEILRRIKRDRLSFDHAWLLRYWALKREVAKSGKPFLGPSDPVKACDEFIEAARGWDARNATEGTGFEAYVPQLKIIVAPPALPKDKADGLRAGAVEIPCEMFRLHRRPEMVDIVDDPKASTGKAARMPGGSNEWAVQWQFPHEIDDNGARWRCWAVVRCEAKGKSGRALSCGLYDTENQRSLADLAPTIEQIGDGEYHRLDLGAHELSSAVYVWVAPPGNADDVAAVYVDRFIIQREP